MATDNFIETPGFLSSEQISLSSVCMFLCAAELGFLYAVGIFFTNLWVGSEHCHIKVKVLVLFLGWHFMLGQSKYILLLFMF